MTSMRGFDRLHHPALNKSTAFTEDERDRYGLRGLLPANVSSQEHQIARVLENMRRKQDDIEQYIFLTALEGRNERLFYRILIDHVDEVLPLVYTPTVGEACQQFAHIFRNTRGFYVTPADRGRIRSHLDNWPEPDVRVVVITDGERILGLGDLGANGMGIPIGKLALYTAFGGIAPQHCLPVMFDVGTENVEVREDPMYLGVRQSRLRGDAYESLMDEFVEAVTDRYPDALIQFEDFRTPTAYALLRRYRDRVCCFNDDIQGTAAVALGGVIAACRLAGKRVEDLQILFAGAGSAATGIADLMVAALEARGLSADAARRRIWLVDSAGLVVTGRGDDLASHKVPYAHDASPRPLLEALRDLKPDVLIGATGQPGTFTEDVVRAMARAHERPIVFALSNPTSRAECTAEEAWRWSDGRVIFASGSPFPALETGDGRTWRPGQGNNAYVFPGVGLGVTATRCSAVTDAMFLTAAETLADQVDEDDLAQGTVYPPLREIRAVSRAIALAVARSGYAEGVARLPQPDDLAAHIAGVMYDPVYQEAAGDETS